MIKVLLADDEGHAIERIKQLLSDYPDFHVVAQATDGDQLVKELMTRKIDMAFLDINMPGLPVFQTLPSLKNPPVIVFQTAYPDHALQAFGVNAVDYLLKPVSRERFRQCIEKIRKALASETNTPPSGEPQEETPPLPRTQVAQVSVKDGNAIKVIKVAEIHKIEMDQGFSFLFSGTKKYITDKYLTYFEELLGESGFYRVNRNSIINLKYVKALHPMFNNSFLAELTNGEKIEVSRRRAKGLKELLTFL